MATKLVRVNCPKCGPTAGTMRAPTHWLHFIMTLLTAGLWLLVWIPRSIMNSMAGEVRCNQCGVRTRRTRK